MGMHMETQVTPKGMSSSDDTRDQFVLLAALLEELQGGRRRRMAHQRQELPLPEEQLPQLAGHREDQVPIPASDQAGAHSLREPLPVQPATRGAQAALAGEGNYFLLAAGAAAQAHETCRGRAAREHQLQGVPRGLPDILRHPPGHVCQGLVAVVLQDLPQHRSM